MKSFSPKGKTVLVVGLGKSGMSVARFLAKRGAAVTATDMRQPEDLGEEVSILETMGISLELGGHRIETAERSDLVIVSPGVPHTIPVIAGARTREIPVWGELELASRFIAEPIVAVTGTNGKTTTTQLIGDMLTRSGRSVFVGGNIGTPLTDYIDQTEKKDVLVIEVSSFQLDTIETFRPHVAVLLNITEDHLDRYEGMAQYAASKARIFHNQGETDTAVLNGGDPLVLPLADRVRARKVFFNLPEGLGGDAVLNGTRILLEGKGGPRAIDLGQTSLGGRHNHENIAASALAAIAAGGSMEGVQKAVDEFRNLAHRLDHVADIQDVHYYDDSKATNVDAVVRAMETFQGPVILIMGGRDKRGGYHVLKNQIRLKGKMLILIGEAKERIRETLGGLTETRDAQSMEEAVRIARTAAKPGDTVLLSPACASFDMFESYAHRGEMFRRAVLGEQEATNG